MKKNKSKFPTLRQIREAHGWKRNYEKYLPLGRFVFRPVGFLLTWIAIRMGLTTEAAAWLSGIIGIAGCLFLAVGPDFLLPVGLALLLFFNLLDCVDGSIARTMKTENPYGRFLDSVCGGIVDLGFWGIIGILAFRHSSLTIFPDPFGYGRIVWLLIGCAACFFSFFLGYLEQNFDKLLRYDWNKIQAPSKETRLNKKEHVSGKTDFISNEGNGKGYILRMINNNLRVRETHYLFLIVAYLFQAIDFLLAAYLLYYLFQNIILMIVYARRGRKIRKLYTL